jgi:hypothetical protein
MRSSSTKSDFSRWPSRRSLASSAAILALSGAVAFAACSSNDDNPTPTPTFTSGSGGAGGSAGGGSGGDQGTGGDGTGGSTGGSAGGGGTAGSGGAAGSAGGVSDGGAGGPKDAAPDINPALCTSDAGCWSCPPLKPEDFLNHCTASQCSHFDDSTRLPPQYRDGGLPPF